MTRNTVVSDSLTPETIDTHSMPGDLEDALVTEEQVLRRLKNFPLLYHSYQCLTDEWRRYFLDFCQGKKSLPLTYDPFFKQIFHPDIHPDRLSRLVSSILE